MVHLNLTKSEIEALIPHAGGMCLLEKVFAYSSDEIICQTRSHLLADNPLKNNGILSRMHLIEYGAQAIAIHGGLMQRDVNPVEPLRPKMAYIAMLKSITWGAFNPFAENLQVKAKVIVADDMAKRYAFCIIDVQQVTVCSGIVMIAHPLTEVTE